MQERGRTFFIGGMMPVTLPPEKPTAFQNWAMRDLEIWPRPKTRDEAWESLGQNYLRTGKIPSRDNLINDMRHIYGTGRLPSPASTARRTA